MNKEIHVPTKAHKAYLTSFQQLKVQVLLQVMFVCIDPLEYYPNQTLCSNDKIS